MKTTAVLMMAQQTTAKGGPPLFGHYVVDTNMLAVPPRLLCKGNCRTYAPTKKLKRSCSSRDRIDYAELGMVLDNLVSGRQQTLFSLP